MPYNLLINSNCNLDCEYCFAKEILSQADSEISLESVNYVIQFFKNSNFSEISLAGGEPTLHSQFHKIMESLLENDLMVSIKTNALWKKEIKDLFHNLPMNRLSFLLNINPPSKYNLKRWKTILKNIDLISDARVVLSLNIDSIDFDHKYLLKIARDYNIEFLRWSFAHPIFNRKKKGISQRYLPLIKYRSVADKILSVIQEAHKLGMSTLGDHSVIYCMFTPEQHLIIDNLEAELNTKCEGTLDILPDLQVIYCLPMYSFFPKIYLYEFESLQEIDLYFESRINCFRTNSYPFEECSNCEYASKDICHGGCLAHRTYPQIRYEELTHRWDTNYLLEKILYIPNIISIEPMVFSKRKNNSANGFVVHNKEKDSSVQITNEAFRLLKILDTERPLKQLINKIESEFRCNVDEIEDNLFSFFESCRTFDILRIRH